MTVAVLRFRPTNVTALSSGFGGGAIAWSSELSVMPTKPRPQFVKMQVRDMITWYRTDDDYLNGLGFVRAYLKRRQQEQRDEARCADLVTRWGATIQGLGLARDTSSNVGLPGLDAPKVTHIVLDGLAERLTVRVLPGQMVENFQEMAREIAEGMRVAYAAFRWRAHGVLVVELLRHDPLETIVDLPAPITGEADRFLLCRVESNSLLDAHLSGIAHLLVQGQTRSGKSRWVYGFLSQLAKADNVRISGSDITGLLLRPLQHSKHDQDLALGTRNLEHHAQVLERLVERMDERIARIPDRRDTLPISADDPYEVVVIEELPGLKRAADNLDARHKATKDRTPLAARIQEAYGRLLAEGAKVGFRVLIIMQRAEAKLIGGFERGQAVVRISFAVGDPDSVRMLHPTVDEQTALRHTLAKSGQGLISGPGIPVQRMRSPQMGDYGAFVDLVKSDVEAVA